MELSDRYSPQEVEGRLYKWWESEGFFKSQDQSQRTPFSIILPPPNVTGQLHIGHALNHTLQDVLIRWKRMSGYNAMWLPGTDHAGIATQGVVEKEIAKENLTRHQLGREKFVNRIWDWKKKYGERIVEQMKFLGDSCDWDRFTFTLDEGVSQAVRRVFVELYKKDLIYKGKRLINWSPKLESALSDLEVEYKEIRGHLYHIRYPLASGAGEVVVATTRPETLLGDVAVAVHPEDERYVKLIGKHVKLPLTGRTIPVIADSSVEKEFGSGVVKITPGHDFNDYEMGVRHKLEMINILNRDGTLNENGLKYKGLKTQEARKRVLEDLAAEGFLVKEEPHVHSVGHCSRSGVVAEPILSEQWFVKMEKLAKPAKSVVENGTVTFEPEAWTKTYLHWMNNIKDWCISRQLWWGHRIPACNCADCKHITVSEVDPSKCEKCGSVQITQEEDVLDTWFSSALWPFSTMGWPKETEALKTFYPTDVLVTGHDIIFFWVARMIMMGLEFRKDVPFRKVVITGLIRDAEGRKMSKSLGNALDPVELIQEFGADSVRFTLLAQVAAGKDLKFSVPRLEGYRNFMNKIWNAARFSLSVLKDLDVAACNSVLQNPDAQGLSEKSLPKKELLSDPDVWIIYKLGECERLVDEHLKELRFSEASNVLYDFVWHQFCDWYLELIKPVVYGQQVEQKQTTQIVLAQTLNRIVRLLHPFVPFISEEIYQKLPIRGVACITDQYPTPRTDRDWIALGSRAQADELDLVIEVISSIRNIRGENRIKPSEDLRVRLSPKESGSQKILQANKSYIMKLAKLGECEIKEEGSLSKCALTPVHILNYSVEVIVYLEGLVDLAEERKRIEKAIEKFQKEMSGLSGRLSNDNFVKNAPAEVVEQGRVTLTELSSKIKTLEKSLERLN
jgi:valyl-tRNA synthetase